MKRGLRVRNQAPRSLFHFFKVLSVLFGRLIKVWDIVRSLWLVYSELLLLPLYSVYKIGKVVSHKHDIEERSKGHANKYAACDTRKYVVQYPDGTEAEFLVNMIA